MRWQIFPLIHNAKALVIPFALLVMSTIWPARDARACGCLAPPDVSAPLLQAGEEILFVVDNMKITMHVKLRYSGRAGDFGWLLPLPAVPTNSQGMQGIDIGSEELFQQLETRTQPTYELRKMYCVQPSTGNSGGGCSNRGCGSALAGAGSFDPNSLPPENSAEPSPLVKQDSAGPFEYAILKADDKTAMLQWLQMNNYVVPAGTDGAVAPYIHPGAYFLALRLRAGATTGDLQPVVLSYPSDLPMIPIMLTAVGATQNMGILVWVLGNGRAIPRNYASVIINDSKLDWLNKAANYKDLVTSAIAEAPNKHAFVTEEAGSSELLSGVLDVRNRFDVLSTVKSERDPVRFVEAIQPQFLVPPGYGTDPTFMVVSGFALNGQFFSVVGARIPMPQQLIAEQVTPDVYYANLRKYLVTDRAMRPSAYTDIEAKLAAFDPQVLAQELTDRIVTPTLREGALFKQPQLSWLTRLYTTLSPEDMTADPVFDLNRDMPPQSATHTAVLTVDCGGGGTLRTNSGFVQSYTQDEIYRNAYKPANAPSSQRIERLYDRGAPEVMTDNTQIIKDALNMQEQGCTTTHPQRNYGPAPYLSLCAAALATLLLRRRLFRPAPRR